MISFKFVMEKQGTTKIIFGKSAEYNQFVIVNFLKKLKLTIEN